MPENPDDLELSQNEMKTLLIENMENFDKFNKIYEMEHKSKYNSPKHSSKNKFTTKVSSRKVKSLVLFGGYSYNNTETALKYLVCENKWVDLKYPKWFPKLAGHSCIAIEGKNLHQGPKVSYNFLERLDRLKSPSKKNRRGRVDEKLEKEKSNLFSSYLRQFTGLSKSEASFGEGLDFSEKPSTTRLVIFGGKVLIEGNTKTEILN